MEKENVPSVPEFPEFVPDFPSNSPEVRAHMKWVLAQMCYTPPV